MRIAGRNYVERKAQVRQLADLTRMAREIASHIPRMSASCSASAEFDFWFSGELESVRRNASSPEQGELLARELLRARDYHLRGRSSRQIDLLEATSEEQCDLKSLRALNGRSRGSTRN